MPKEVLTFMVEPEIKKALQALANRDSEVTVSAIIRKGIEYMLGMNDHAFFSKESMNAAVDRRLSELGLTKEIRAVGKAQDKLIKGVKANELWFDEKLGMLRPGPRPEEQS